MTETHPSTKKRISLKPPVKTGERESYATAMLYNLNGQDVEIVVGARTKKLVKELFAALVPGYEAIAERIYKVTWKKNDD